MRNYIKLGIHLSAESEIHNNCNDFHSQSLTSLSTSQVERVQTTEWNGLVYFQLFYEEELKLVYLNFSRLL